MKKSKIMQRVITMLQQEQYNYICISLNSLATQTSAAQRWEIEKDVVKMLGIRDRRDTAYTLFNTFPDADQHSYQAPFVREFLRVMRIKCCEYLMQRYQQEETQT